MNFKNAVDDKLNEVKEIVKSVFPYMSHLDIKAVHDSDDPEEEGAHYIDMDWYMLSPVVGKKPSIRGMREVLQWNIMTVIYHSGSFNPYNGGEPPYSDERDMGTCDTVADCLAEIGKEEVLQKISNVLERIRESEVVLEEIEYESEPHTRCPHDREYDECNECMILSDQAYKTMRERHHFP